MVRETTPSRLRQNLLAVPGQFHCSWIEEIRSLDQEEVPVRQDPRVGQDALRAAKVPQDLPSFIDEYERRYPVFRLRRELVLQVEQDVPVRRGEKDRGLRFRTGGSRPAQ